MKRPVFNVRDFGANGNGRDNDTAAIQRAIDAASAAGRGTVFFPEGAYSVRQAAERAPFCLQLKSNLDYRGVGAGSKLALAPEQPNSTRLMSTQNVREPHDIRILDLHLDGNRWNQNLSYEQLHGIMLVGVKWGQVENCVIHDFVGDGIYAHQGDTGSDAIYVAGNEFYGINRVAINFKGTSSSTAEKNYIHDCVGHPFKMEMNDGDVLNLRGNSFLNNRAIKTAGLVISGVSGSQLNEMTVRGNYFEDTSGEEAITLRLVKRGFRVEENVIVRPEQIGIVVVSAQGEVVIARNTIQQAGTLTRMFPVGTTMPPNLKDHDRGAITIYSASGFVIEKNYILNSFIQGIFLNDCRNTSGRNVVRLNLITGSVESLYTKDHLDFPAGLWLKNAANTDVLLNEIWQNAGVGVILSQGSADNKFRCNRIKSNRGGGVLVKADAGANNDFGISSANPGNNTFENQNVSYGIWAVKNERPGPANRLSAQSNFWGLPERPDELERTEGEVDRSNPLPRRPSAEACPGMP